jgi:polyphosphate kinase 2
MKRKAYEEALEGLQEQLVAMARWAAAKGERIVVLFEGRDTAGKGGAISAVRHALNPRQCRVVALGKPTDAEHTQWYFQRYIEHLPSAGEIVLFDRSWYNRAGVETVMGFAGEEEVARFLSQAPVFEKLLVDDGMRLFKYWLATDQENQEERLKERYDDPLKRWKLSPIDLAARSKYPAYTEAREAMLAATNSEWAPWRIVDFNDQKRGRLTLIADLLERLPDTSVPPAEIDFAPIPGKPLKEVFPTLQPLPDFKA